MSTQHFTITALENDIKQDEYVIEVSTMAEAQLLARAWVPSGASFDWVHDTPGYAEIIYLLPNGVQGSVCVEPMEEEYVYSRY